MGADYVSDILKHDHHNLPIVHVWHLESVMHSAIMFRTTYKRHHNDSLIHLKQGLLAFK